MEQERITKVYGNSLKPRKIKGQFVPPVYLCDLDPNVIETYDNFEYIDEKLKDHFAKLASSIREHGIKEPLFVWNMYGVEHGNDVGYRVAMGNSRLYVAKQLKLETVPCLIVNNRGNGPLGERHESGKRLETDEEVFGCFSHKDVRLIKKNNIIFSVNVGFKEYPATEKKPKKTKKKVVKKKATKKKTTKKK